MTRPEVAPAKRSTCSTRSLRRPLSCWMSDAIALHLCRIGGELAAQVVGGGVDHGERGAQFVGDAGDEIHLQVGQSLGAAGVGDEGGDARHHQQEYAGGDREVAPARLRHDGFERAGAMAREHLPAPRFANGSAAAAPTSAAAGSAGITAEDLVVGCVEQAHRGVGVGSHLRPGIGLVDDGGRVLAGQDFHLIIESPAGFQVPLHEFGQQDTRGHTRGSNRR